MTRIASAFHTLRGLFFDEGWLALTLVVLLAYTGIVAKHVAPWAAIAILVGGTLALLFGSVMRAATSSDARSADCSCNATSDA